MNKNVKKIRQRELKVFLSVFLPYFSSSLLDLDPLSSSGPSAPSAAPTSWGGNFAGSTARIQIQFLEIIANFSLGMVLFTEN